jgi:enamine deaminase RidA (YjgF/YER057c/UK114 family)
MAERTNMSSGSPFEPTFGFSRAVKVGNMVFVSGSTAIQPDGTVAGVGDAYTQAVETLRTIEKALQQAGASLQEVVRTRVFVTDLNHFAAVQKAHAECFGAIRPASTVVEISRLVHPDMLIEIEADAVILK